jgi:predicted polyphosphate/ATP-dependent NAD kinase
MAKLGLIVNPVAGIGGKIGLKGSDGDEIRRKALEMGAVPESGIKTAAALRKLTQSAVGEVELLCYPGEMGEDSAREAGLKPTVLGLIETSKTAAVDTLRAAGELKEAKVDLLLFAGGDGTARDILDAVGTSIPALGIPAGCKIHSAVYAVNPRSAGELAAQYLLGNVRELREAEVMDINEDLFRQNRVEAKLYGYLKVPCERRMMQNLKSGRGLSESASIQQISHYIADTLEDDVLYIVAPGSTTKYIMNAAGLPATLLGVDLVYNRKIVMNDVAERDILSAMDRYPKAKIIVTIIGGQGYVFGRGNQQISAEVIRRVGRDNIVIAAAKDKVFSLFGQHLYADTGDENVNSMLRGYYRIIVGYEDYCMMRVTD